MKDEKNMEEQRPNIIFIVVDAFRPENLGCYGYQRDTSPNIDRLAQRAVLFENCYACSNATDPTFTSIFSGKYPISHGIIHHGPKVTDKEEERFYQSDIKLLAEILKSNGYTTIGIDWLSRWHKRGFDYYWSDEEGKDIRTENIFNKMLKKLPVSLHNFLFKIIRKRRLFLPDHEGGNFTKIAIDKIDKVKDAKLPFFVLIHYWDTHVPFRIPHEYFEKFNTIPKKTKIKDLLNKIKNKEWRDYVHKALVGPMFTYVEEFNSMYDATINYVDFQIGRIIEFLKSSGLEENTLLIITGDHGTAIGKHIPFFDHHGIFEETIRVPLIIKYGSRFPQKRISSIIQQIDIIPTVLELLGIDSEKYEFNGYSLFSAIKTGSEIKREYAYISDANGGRFAILDGRLGGRGRYKYIFSKDEESAKCNYCDEIHEGETEVLFDLEKDPDETQNVLEKNTDIVTGLKKELFGWLENSKYADISH